MKAVINTTDLDMLKKKKLSLPSQLINMTFMHVPMIMLVVGYNN